MNKERELLERLLNTWERPCTAKFRDLFNEVRELLSENPADEGPVGQLHPNGLFELLLEDLPMHLAFPVKLYPAPRKEFVRLSQEEIQTIYLTRYDTPNLFARAIEDALEEKNK